MSYVSRGYEQDLWRRGIEKPATGSLSSALLTGLTIALYVGVIVLVALSIAHDLGFGDPAFSIL